jgi:hypothetical protein
MLYNREFLFTNFHERKVSEALYRGLTAVDDNERVPSFKLWRFSDVCAKGLWKESGRSVQQGDSKGMDSDFDVGQLVGVVNEEVSHKKLIICSELLNWETLVNFYMRQN